MQDFAQRKTAHSREPETRKQRPASGYHGHNTAAQARDLGYKSWSVCRVPH
jgi:hypothetical protein